VLRDGRAGHEDNQHALRAFLREADVAYIEAVFREEDSGHAARKAHLTASQAGRIAREAGVKLAVPFHFSSRYFPDEQRLREQFEHSYCG
jgi:ribonuclease Z